MTSRRHSWPSCATEGIDAGGDVSRREVVDGERLDGEREVQDLDRIAVEAGDVDERSVRQHVHAAPAEEIDLHHRAGGSDIVGGVRERGDIDLELMVPGVREDRSILQVRTAGTCPCPAPCPCR